jgi:hypothetical protein
MSQIEKNVHYRKKLRIRAEASYEANDQFRSNTPGQARSSWILRAAAPLVPVHCLHSLLPTGEKLLCQLCADFAELVANVLTDGWQDGNSGQGEQKREQCVFDQILPRFLFVQVLQESNHIPPFRDSNH